MLTHLVEPAYKNGIPGEILLIELIELFVKKEESCCEALNKSKESFLILRKNQTLNKIVETEDKNGCMVVM